MVRERGRRGYFNINHLSNILTGFKNPILSILPLSTGGDYQPPCCLPPTLPKLSEWQTGTGLAQPHPAPTNITCWDFYRVSPHPQSQVQHAIFRKSPLQKRPMTHLSVSWSIVSDDARQTVITSEGGEVKEVAVDEKGSHQYCMETRPP